MEFFEHGGGVAEAARELGVPLDNILDFSASVNPLGPPPRVLAAARRALNGIMHYPEIAAGSLVASLERYHGIPGENLLVGSGATELMYLFPHALHPRHALLIAPAFSEFEPSLELELEGTEVDILPLRAEEDFRLDPELLLHRLAPTHDLIWFANPGNPAASVIEPGVVEEIAHAVREQALVAVDEAFIDFCPEYSVLPRVPSHGNLFVFRSFAKFYAIPGLRAGYLAGPQRGISHMRAAQPPWCLSTPALAAAMACLEQNDFRRQSLETIPRLRAELAEGLSALGFRVFPSRANYLLVRLQQQALTSGRLTALLRARGILIRDCAASPSLNDRYLRVAVRSTEENERLLTALRESL